MKRPELELEWALITVTAAALVAALLVSCAPTHRSYPLSSLQAPAPDNPVAPTTSRAPGADAVVAGHWTCEDSSSCVVTEISLLPDGSAIADGQKSDLSVEDQGQNMIHLTLSVPAHDGIAAATLEGDISTGSPVTELTLGDSLYERAPSPEPSTQAL